MNAIQFLITILFDLAMMVVIFRIWLQIVQADYYNPLSQAVVKISNPLVLPLRKLLPTLGKLDTASILLLFLLAVAKIFVTATVAGYATPIIPVLTTAALACVGQFLQLLFWILIIRALMSWFSQGYNPMEAALAQLTEPMLAPIRRVIPALGGLDLSVLVLLIAVQFLRYLIGV